MEIHGTTKKGKTLLGYYLSLFVLTIFLSRPNVAYGEVLRLGYLALLVIPLFVSKKYSIAAFTTFVGISFNSFYPMLPSIYTPYVLIAFTIMYPLAGIRMNRLTIPIIFLFFAIREYLCIDINIEFLVWGFVAIMLSTKINTEEDVKHLMISFIFVSFFLSFMLLLYASFFMSVYSIDDNLERVGWINQNLFGGTVGLGQILALYLLLNRKRFNINKYIQIFCIVTFAICYAALIINSSRGAIISVTLCSILFLCTSKVKVQYLLIAIIALFIFVVYLYNNGYFELLIYRMQDDTLETGGGRTEIFAEKLAAFFELPILEKLFGLGYENSIFLGSIKLDTHNDFATSLFAYGYIGLILFLTFILAPLFIVSRKCLRTICILLLYLILESALLSPIFRGYFLFTMFYVLLSRIAYLSKNKDFMI